MLGIVICIAGVVVNVLYVKKDFSLEVNLRPNFYVL